MLARSKRLQKELQQLRNLCEEEKQNIYLGPVDHGTDREMELPISDKWSARIRGPPDSYYDGYYFDLTIDIPSEYPLVPPRVSFSTKIFHPNVLFEVRLSAMTAAYVWRVTDREASFRIFYLVARQSGEICLDILKRDAWSPAWSLHSTCRALIALLADPAADR